ncbi:Neuropeptides capa receptor [Papilio machaon]|uniref:Neuropeptides capa receptor n=1 Tax=Papilio machaon TaxID=76193 RepID=A0A0N1I9U7_PAPMA|nr:Neuropeptides capa receptor [Papilio machaon]
MFNLSEAHDNDKEIWLEFLINCRKEEPPWMKTAFVITVHIIILISLIENLLTCAVICYDKTMHTVTNYYLLNLAVSDIITTLAVLMGAVDSFEQATCKINYLIIIVLWNNTILTLTMLSIERFVAIWYPLQLKSNSDWRRVLKVITVIWIIALMETIPEFWTLELLKADNTLICSTVPTPLARIINGVLALVTFLIPMVIMSYVYFMIAFKVNVVQKRYTNNKIFNHQDHRKKVNKLVGKFTSFI